MKFKSGMLFLILSFVFTACTPTINYLGDSYDPTTEVDVYWDKEDIKKEYRVMGIAKNEGYEMDMDDPFVIKTEMVKKAKMYGADAVLFTGAYAETIRSYDTSTTQDGDQSYASTTSNSVKIYEAKFLKYQ